MAIISDLKPMKVGHQSETASVLFFESEAAGTLDSVDVTDLVPHFGHWFASVQMYDGDNIQIEDSTGTFAILVGTWCNGILEAPPTASIDATAPVTVDWSGPTTRVQVTPTGLTDAVTWVLRLVAVRD